MFKRAISSLALAFALLSSTPAAAQVAPEESLVTTYLQLNNIPWVQGDWNTCDPGTGDQICSWNTADLGPQPSQATLNTYEAQALNIQSAQNFFLLTSRGFTVSCASGDTICAAAEAGTYGMQPSDLLLLSLQTSSIVKSGTFADGTSAISIFDTSNNSHTFNVQQFLELASAEQAYYAAALAAYNTLLTGASATFPTAAALSSSGVTLTPPPANSVSMTNSSGIQQFGTSLPSGLTLPSPVTTNLVAKDSSGNVQFAISTAGVQMPQTTPSTWVCSNASQLLSNCAASGMTLPFSMLSGLPTTLAGYGVTAVPYSLLTGKPTTLSAASITDTLTATGDVTGSASPLSSDTINLTLSNSGATAGTYDSATQIVPKTFDAKGRLTGTGSPVAYAPAWDNITGKPALVTKLTGSTSITGNTFLTGGCLPATSVTVTGAALGNQAYGTPVVTGTEPTFLQIGALVTAANTVTLTVCTGLAGTIPTQTYNVTVIQ